MLLIKSASTYKPEREYICYVLFGEFLGINYKIQFEDRNDWCITGDDGAELLMPDIFFQTPDDQWLTQCSLPDQPLKTWNARQSGMKIRMTKNQIPVIYGDLSFGQKQKSAQVAGIRKTLTIPIDIIGSSFFMLSRYEEVVKKERDEHDRFPAWASLAYQEGFIDRPIVNEYLEILWTYMKSLWPRLRRKERTFQMRVTCDVDHPYQDGLRNPMRQIRTIGADLIRRKNPLLAAKSAFNYLASRFGNYSFDPYLSAIYWIMDVNEKAGKRVTFYFKAGQTDPQFDSAYSLDDPIARKLLRDIHDRGHEIGLHPSYRTYWDAEQLCIEANNLRRVLEEEKIYQNRLGSRQHYLRWDSAITPAILGKAGIDYDTTLSFADHAGFRCGTAMSFTMWNWQERRQSICRQKPLILMECTIISSRYMNLGYTRKALSYMMLLLERSTKFGGNFTILWHNSHLISKKDNEFYKTIISYF